MVLLVVSRLLAGQEEFFTTHEKKQSKKEKPREKLKPEVLERSLKCHFA